MRAYLLFYCFFHILYVTSEALLNFAKIMEDTFKHTSKQLEFGSMYDENIKRKRKKKAAKMELMLFCWSNACH